MLKVFAAPYAMIGLALMLAFAPAGCTADQQASFNANLVTTTQNVVALQNALISVDKTIVDNLLAEEKLLAPYKCGAYALASAIVEGSPAATKVNAYLAKNVAAGVANVAVKDICSALGYPTTVTSTSSTSDATPTPTPSPVATKAA
jgi:hypothetical protein